MMGRSRVRFEMFQPHVSHRREVTAARQAQSAARRHRRNAAKQAKQEGRPPAQTGRRPDPEPTPSALYQREWKRQRKHKHLAAMVVMPAAATENVTSVAAVALMAAAAALAAAAANATAASAASSTTIFGPSRTYSPTSPTLATVVSPFAGKGGTCRAHVPTSHTLATVVSPVGIVCGTCRAHVPTSSQTLEGIVAPPVDTVCDTCRTYAPFSLSLPNVVSPVATVCCTRRAHVPSPHALSAMIGVSVGSGGGTINGISGGDEIGFYVTQLDDIALRMLPTVNAAAASVAADEEVASEAVGPQAGVEKATSVCRAVVEADVYAAVFEAAEAEMETAAVEKVLDDLANERVAAEEAENAESNDAVEVEGARGEREGDSAAAEGEEPASMPVKLQRRAKPRGAKPRIARMGWRKSGRHLGEDPALPALRVRPTSEKRSRTPCSGRLNVCSLGMCIDGVGALERMSCGHVYCTACMRRWSSTQRMLQGCMKELTCGSDTTCPLCRATV
jgi:hypothetical protein